MIYRNVYIRGKKPKFTGNVILFYSGHLYEHAEHMKNISQIYDRQKDYYMSCDCDSKKFSALIKQIK